MREETLTINKEYAEKYDKWRQKEELQKLKDKYGNISDLDSESDSSTSESEDENAEGLTAAVERDWLKTLAALKNKDPKIYDKNEKFYESEDESESSEESPEKKKKDKPVYLKDYERQVILQKQGKYSDESDDDEDDNITQKPSYVEEQEAIKQSFKHAIDDSGDESSDSEFLTKKVKSSKDEAKEDGDYLVWLNQQKKEKKEEKQVGIDLGSLKEYWNRPELDDREKFLRDYILKQQYLEEDADRIPTYDEIIDDGEGLSDDEENLEKQEEFERKYNFRYEEPDPEFIKSFPRTIDDTVRRKESKRAEKRQKIAERKKAEKEKRKLEIKQLKNLKKKEIMDKLDKLKEITGNKSLGLNLDDIEGDFDPEKHDQMMKECFNDDYYGEDDDETKPVFTDDEEDLLPENWDNWKGPEAAGEEDQDDNDNEPHIDDPNFVMDADYDPTQEVKKSSKKKKRSKFKQALMKNKPVFDPEQKSFEEYFNEYYSLDYEDVIDDKPCRFRYRTVVPNDFGLSVNEVLSSRDKELNAWVSLKKMSQYRSKEEELEDVKLFTQKSQNSDKKSKILSSLVEKQETSAEDLTENKSKKKRKKKKKAVSSSITNSGNADIGITDTPSGNADIGITDTASGNADIGIIDTPSGNADIGIADTPSGDADMSITDTASGDADMSITDTPSGDNMEILPSTSGVKRRMTDNLSNKKAKKKRMENSQQKGEDNVSASEASPKKKNKNKKISQDNTKQAVMEKEMSKMEALSSKSKSVSVKPSAVKNSDKQNKNLKVKNKKKKNSANTQQAKVLSVSKELTLSDKGTSEGQSDIKTKKKKKKKKKFPKLPDERLLAYGINPKKLKFMKINNVKKKEKGKK